MIRVALRATDFTERHNPAPEEAAVHEHRELTFDAARDIDEVHTELSTTGFMTMTALHANGLDKHAFMLVPLGAILYVKAITNGEE